MLKQKLLAAAMIVLGLSTAYIFDDGTACVMILMIMVPVLFAKENVENEKVSRSHTTEND